MERRSIAHIATVAAVIAACVGLAEGSASARTASLAAAPAKAPPARAYVVKTGDGGWFQIAQAHHTTLQHLLAANKATAATPVDAGQKIKLPADARVDTKASARPAQTTAKRGRTAAATAKTQPRSR
jgi:LysM repeat protein